MPVTEGRGAPGAPVSEVLTIQGVTNGTPVPVSGGGVSGADESTFTAGVTPGTVAQFAVDETATDQAAEGTVGAARMSPDRQQYTIARDAGPSWTPAFATHDSADGSTIGDLTAAPTSGQKIVVDDVIISVGATAMTVTLSEETSTTVIFKQYMPANSTIQITPRDGRKLPTADKKLRRQTSAAGNVFVHCGYHSEA